jgi:hypothetical protein
MMSRGYGLEVCWSLTTLAENIQEKKNVGIKCLMK